MNAINELSSTITAEQALKSWGRLCLPNIHDLLLPEAAICQPSAFPVNGRCLDFSDPSTFERYHAITYLRAVFKKLLINSFPALQHGHYDQNGDHYADIDSDPRLTFLSLQDSRYAGLITSISLQQIYDVLNLHYHHLNLAPSKTGYALGKKTAELADEIAKKERSASIFELGVGSGIIMAATLKNTQAENIFYIGGDIDERCLCLSDINMQINSIPRRKYRLKHGDLFAPIQYTKVHLIVSNPPYFPENFAKARSQITGEFEAINGGYDGLDFYRIIFQKGPDKLLPKGKILVQVSNVNLGVVKNLAKVRFGQSAKISVVRENGRQIEQDTNRGKAILIEF